MKKSLFLLLVMAVSAVLLPLAVYANRFSVTDVPSEPLPSATGEESVFSAAPPVFSTATTANSHPPAAVTGAVTSSAATVCKTTPTVLPADPPDPTVSVLVDGVCTELALEEAVMAVVAAEMPALFPPEALKAQAVAARTYIAYRAAHPVSAHPEAVICDDPSHCCALADLDALALSWGEQGETYAARIREAAVETAGEILTVDGAPIMAVFHAMSGETTNSAADVWGGDVGYLVSVAAPQEEAALDGYADSVIVAAEEFRRVFLLRYPAAELNLQRLDWFSEFEHTEGGLLRAVSVGGVKISGPDNTGHQRRAKTPFHHAD